MNTIDPAATDRADHLIAMAGRLVELITAEIEALKVRRLDGASADWDEKERLAHAWRLEVAQIKTNPALLAGARPDQKSALREVSRKLESVVTIHAAALAAMKEVTEGLVRTIAGEIASSRGAPAGYGRSGALHATGAKAAGLAVNAKA
ncbi:MAG: flagellar basal-body protein FlbY [Alphaproteobacteria bacterium]|nr:flagellar basal-body protein FlbY [Alphaproteobacteria bacterium]